MITQYPFGLPATLRVQIGALPSVGNTLTIDSVVYTFGTDFFGEDSITIAQNLAAAIATPLTARNSATQVPAPVKSVTAYAYGPYTTVIATVPGTAGNSLAASTNNSAAFILSGATFAGGTDGPGTVDGAGTPDINLEEVGGTAVATGTGAVTAGTQRVTLATGVNSGVNVAQLNGVAPSLGSGVVDAGTLRVNLATDGATVSVLGATTDAAAADATGSINAHVRQIAKINTGVSVTFQNAAAAIGNGTALTVTGMATCVVQGTVTGTNTTVFEGSLDGTNWVAMNGRRLDNGTNYTTYNSSGAIFFFDVVGLMSFRCRVSAWTSGTVTLFGNAVPNAGNQVQVSTNSVNGANVTTQSGSFGNVTDTSSNFTAMPPASDGTRTPGFVEYAMRYNPTRAVWERARNNNSTVLLATGARTTTQTSSDIINYDGRGLHFSIDVTVIPGGSITPSIQGKDANGIYYTVLTGTAITTVSTTVLKLGPGITTVANGAASDFLPGTFRLVLTVADATSITYSSAYTIFI